jgi:hypothetical protein
VVAFRICHNPGCGCSVVGFECQPEMPGAAPHRFDVDVMTREFSAQPDRTEGTRTLSEAFLNELGEQDWVWLMKLFLATKARMMETLNLDTVDAQFPAEVEAGEATMVGYREVFPWAEQLQFNLAGADWLADDHHCVDPDCNCTQASLAFYRAPAGGNRQSALLNPSVVLYLDRCSGKTKVTKKRFGSPKPAVLVDALRAALRDLADKLRQRAEHLKRLAKRLLPGPECWRDANIPPPGGTDPDATTEPRLANVPAGGTYRSPPRPGRNDPCPCGSGKKFKKCCGV